MSGRLEGYQSDLGAKVGGRVVWVSVREGAVVRAGQVLVQLDDAQSRAQAAASVAAVDAAESRARQSQATLAVLASQINEAALGGEQATADTSGRFLASRAGGKAAVVARARTRGASSHLPSISRPAIHSHAETGVLAHIALRRGIRSVTG